MTYTHDHAHSTVATESATPRGSMINLEESFHILENKAFTYTQNGTDLSVVVHLSALYQIHQEVLANNHTVEFRELADDQALFSEFVEGIYRDGWSPDDGEVNPWLLAKLEANKRYLLADAITASARLAYDPEEAQDHYMDEFFEHRSPNSTFMQGNVSRLKNGSLVYWVDWIRNCVFLPSTMKPPPSSPNKQTINCTNLTFLDGYEVWMSKLANQLWMNFRQKLCEYNSIVGLLKSREYLISQEYGFVMGGSTWSFSTFRRAATSARRFFAPLTLGVEVTTDERFSYWEIGLVY